eukprot:TRINITY_DN28532_c0_g1_i1.p1 TRINITY_DN28532_c0_g1~~TRINITY_DN28532_c0_g1_i1.p1  ORF type:complete len:130 (-),score=8.90 TRINITY_DN28532_c0_g1_i1:65-454(-)
MARTDNGFTDCSRSDTLRVGSRVRLIGLHDKPHHSGLEGTLTEFSKGEHRLLMRMKDATTKLLRPVNVEPIHAGDEPLVSRGDVSDASVGAKAKASQAKAQAALERLRQRAIAGPSSRSNWRDRSRSPR